MISRFVRLVRQIRGGRTPASPRADWTCEALEARRVFFAQAVPGDFGPQTAIQSGEQVELFVDVEVSGDEDYVGLFRATFYLSTDDELGEPEDVVLAQITQVGTVPLAGSVRLSQTVTIPAVVPGEYLLLLTIDSSPGFANTGTSTPVMGVSTDFGTANLEVSPHTLDLEEIVHFDWTADLINQGGARALAEFETILSRDRRIGNGDDIILGGDGTDSFDLEAGAATNMSTRQSTIGDDTPSGSYYFALRVLNPTDSSPRDNIAVTSRPIIAVVGNSVTDGVLTMLGGGQLSAIITHDVGALRANGTGFGPVRESGASKAITYAVRNDGAAPLEILSIEGRGQHPDDFTMSPSFPTSIAPGATQTYTITFDPTDFANRRANFLFTTSDPNRERFRMRIAGQGEAAPSDPDIEVTAGAPNSEEVHEIANNDRNPETRDGTDFGRVPPGAQGDVHIFQIRNAGQSDLVFQLSPDPEISIRAHAGEAANSYLFGVNNPTTQGHLNGVPATLRPGETFNFRIRYAPGGFGQNKPWVEIYTNDPDESLFRFKIVGVASPF